jgi:glutaminyl-tRNA synthetase
MPTICGLRRRGYTPEAVRAFAERVGVAKRDMVADVGLLEYCIREDLEARAPRRMAVLRPLKVVITNMAEAEAFEVEVPNHPDNGAMGTRRVPFTRELFIEQEDFREEAPKKWFRLAPGAEVRLRGACLVTCREVVRDASGQVVELRCEWDPASKGGNAPDGRKVKGTLHWVSAVHAIPAEVRLYEALFTQPDPMDVAADQDWKTLLNPGSLEVLSEARLEPSLAEAKSGERFQFERTGYFTVDPDSRPGKPVFNRTVGLKDSWSKIEAKQ